MVMDVAETLFNRNPHKYVTIQGAIPAANKVCREQPALFNLGLRSSELDSENEHHRALSDPMLSRERPLDRLTRAGVTIYEGSDLGRLLQPGDIARNSSTGTTAEYRGRGDTVPATGKGKGKGFEPFSGTGRRLDDLDSLD